MSWRGSSSEKDAQKSKISGFQANFDNFRVCQKSKSLKVKIKISKSYENI